MLPRAQKGWLRIEVVPGHTPFLISSAILKGLKGIIDVEGKCLGFRGCEETIPLFHVRKNLLGVKVTDLLNKTPHLSDAPSHTHSVHPLRNHSQTKRDMKTEQCH